MGKSVMRSLSWILPAAIAGGAVIVAAISACAPAVPPPMPVTQVQGVQWQHNDRSVVQNGGIVASGRPAKDPKQLFRECRVYKDLIPRGVHARKYRRRMDPKFITIHSTQNFSSSADAWRHSLALKNGKLRARKSRYGNRIGYLVWHYTTDQNVAVQHLPDNEQGEHADFNGPGNNYSIGIEMCENAGNSRSATIERTAMLTAYLMHKHDIPLRNVVPHYHWPRRGLSTPHKNCPHFLLDNGKPGRKWQWFLSKVKVHYDSITVPVGPAQLPVAGISPYRGW